MLTYLYDKVCRHLTESGAETRRAFLAASRNLTELGTAYTAPERIGLPILACPSDHLEHLQLADLVAGATTAAIAGNPYALDLLADLAGLADRNRHGRLGGAGVTVWPPRLIDLYWWLFHEPVYLHKGHPLPLGPDSPPMPWRTFQTTPGL